MTGLRSWLAGLGAPRRVAYRRPEVPAPTAAQLDVTPGRQEADAVADHLRGALGRRPLFEPDGVAGVNTTIDLSPLGTPLHVRRYGPADLADDQAASDQPRGIIAIQVEAWERDGSDFADAADRILTALADLGYVVRRA